MREFRFLTGLVLALGGLLAAAAPAQAASGPWQRLSAGQFHTCAINTASSLYCWGLNDGGQARVGSTQSPQLGPRRVGAAGAWTSVSAGGYHTCGITKADNLYCWGKNYGAQIGDGGAQDPRLNFFRVGGAGVWRSVSAGDAHTCAITNARNLYCWGENDYAQVGDGKAQNPRLSLHRVGAAGVWSTVSAGGSHTCGVTTAKNLYCWGHNGFGQTGDGTQNTPRLTLNRVGGTGVWTRVSTGAYHTCGITTASNLYCWGFDNHGQLGDGQTNTFRLSLFRVGGSGVWAGVSAGAAHTCGVTTGRNLYCWGYNFNGQIGDGGAQLERLNLFRVGGAGVWTAVDTRSVHTCGITAARNLYCWGYNDYGQTGTGTAGGNQLSLHRVP